MNRGDQHARWRLLELAEKAKSESLSSAEQEEMESTLRESADLRLFFAQALHQDACLRFDQRVLTDLTQQSPATMPAQPRKWLTFGLLAAACIVVSGLTFLAMQAVSPQQTPAPTTIATVIKSSHCRWGGSTVPTAEGSRISAGTLDLLEGLATVRFDSGAVVDLEAPATLVIVDAMNCELVRGTVVADVPPQAKGFTVDTPDAKVVDYGTKFGVSSGDDGKYLVKVLEGLVEVSDKKEDKLGQPKQLRGGQSIDTGLRQSQLNPPQGEQESKRWQPNAIVTTRDGWQIISTAYGRGKDTYIQSAEKTKNFGRDPFFRVKHSTFVQNLERKGYLGFDISKFSAAQLEEAELVLSIEPSDLGFASLVPDSTFAVYGVTDESQDDWNENELTWQNAPAHDSASYDGSRPDLGKAVLLGTFQVARGVGQGTRTIRGEALLNFLRQDSNGAATFIICRETSESARDGLAHAFASKESANNTPPLLRVKLSKD